MTAEVHARLAAALEGRYRLGRELGQGGMATVYLAEDLRHQRRVAIKVLHPELSAVIGGERFLAEITVTANLQHPHILPLFDSGAADGLLFYVMPYVEGESLRARMARERQLPVDEAVRLATQVASALDYAHRHGIVHRDVKPENVLLHDGTALVADFGIALAARQEGRLTETGLSLGTPAYMSPEQALGERQLTGRSDVYALGCVLYEMLGGEPPFTGPTSQAVLARLMTEPPRPLAVLRPAVPGHVAAAVYRALEKLPADRFASAAEFAAALADTAFRHAPNAATVALPAATRRARAPGGPLLRAGLVGAVAGALALVPFSLGRRAPAPQPIRVALAFLPGQAPDEGAPIVLSPDGTMLAYQGPASNGTRVWVKRRDRWEATPVERTDGARTFGFSPDGRWLAFVQGADVRKVRLDGGDVVTLADSAADNPGIAWLDDGSIVFVRAGGVLARVASDGGPVQVVARDSFGGFAFPTPLPGRDAVLATRFCTRNCPMTTVFAVDLRSGTAHPVMAGALRAFPIDERRLLVMRPDGALLVVPFDRRRLEPAGPPEPLPISVPPVRAGFPQLALARDGTMAYREGVAAARMGRHRLVWVERTGRESPVDDGWTFVNAFFGGAAGWALSPDGSRVAIGLFTPGMGDDVWVKQLPDGPPVRVTFDSAAEFRPRWHADGRSVFYLSNRARAGVYRRSADGTGDETILLAMPAAEAEMSRDSAWLVARVSGLGGAPAGADLAVLRPGADGAPAALLATAFEESEPALSPDGRWLAYVSDESGRPEVYVRPFPEVARGRHQVSRDGGEQPRWSRDGRELFFVDARRAMRAAAMGANAPAPSAPLTLFPLAPDHFRSMLGRERYATYDVAPDGRFLMARRVRDSVPPPLLMALHWTSELQAQQGTR